MAEALWNFAWLLSVMVVVTALAVTILRPRWPRYRTGGKLTQGAFSQLFNQQGQKIQETLAETYNAKCEEWEVDDDMTALLWPRPRYKTGGQMWRAPTYYPTQAPGGYWLTGNKWPPAADKIHRDLVEAARKQDQQSAQRQYEEQLLGRRQGFLRPVAGGEFFR